MDARRPLTSALRRKVNRSPQAARFAQTALNLDRALRVPPAGLETPSALHREIMRAVRAVAPTPLSPPTLAFPRWFAAAGAFACAVLLLAGYWLNQPRALPATHPVAQTFTSHPPAPDLIGLMAQTAPSSVVSPLAEEFERVGQDLDRTERFLLASLP